MMLEKFKGRRRDIRGWDGCMAWSTEWTWLWANSWGLMKDREAWLATIRGVANSQKQLNDWTTQQVLIMMYLDIKFFGSIPFGIHWAVLICSCFWLIAKSYALFEKFSAIIEKNNFGVYFLYNIVSVSLHIKVNQLNIYIHISPFFWISFPFRPSENDCTGNQPLFFFISYSLFSTSWSTVLCYLPTGPWSYVHFLFSLFSKLVNIKLIDPSAICNILLNHVVL